MSKKIKWIIFCVLGSLLLFLIFSEFLFTQLTKWSLQAYSLSKWGKPLEYENIFWKDGELVIIQPRLDDEISFCAERMTAVFHVEGWKRRIYIDIGLEQPHWKFQALPSSEEKHWQKLLTQDERWIRVYPHFHVKMGMITQTFNEAASSPLYFDLEANNREGGIIKLYFDPERNMQDYLSLHALNTVQGMEVHCCCKNVSCASLNALSQCLNKNFFPYKMVSGVLHGELKAIFCDKQRPYLEGELEIEQLRFYQDEPQLEGYIGNARLKLEKNTIASDTDNQFSTMIGRLDILESASLAFRSPFQEWKIHQVKGSLQLNPFQIVSIGLQGLMEHSNHFSNWNLEGKANLGAQLSPDLNLTLVCSSSDFQEHLGEAHLSLAQYSEQKKHVKIELKELMHTECDVLQALLAAYWPLFGKIQLEDGMLSAAMEGDLTSRGIEMLNIKQFQTSQLLIYLKPWNVHCCFKNIHGYSRVDLAKENFWSSLDAEIHLEEGSLWSEKMSPQICLSNIQSDLLIHEGHIEHSLFTLQLAGLKGKMDVEWGDQKQLLMFKLDGTGEDIAELLPSNLQEGLRENFYRDRVMILANVKRQSGQIESSGILHIQRANTDQMDLIHFGCEFKDWRDCLTSKKIPTGWFYAKQLPLERFLSPFIFGKGLLQMSGEVELKGSFDDRYLTIKYDVDHLKIENEDLCIEAKHLHSSVPGQLMGSHEIDLKTYDYQGTLPIRQASYFEKNHHLLFEGVQGLATFKNQSIHIQSMEAYCKEIYFFGDLKLDYSDPKPGVFDVNIHCPIFSGKVSQTQSLLAHLNHSSSFLYQIPLEGEISAKGEGLKLNFSFAPKNYLLEAELSAAMTHGFFSFEGSDMALKGIDMDIDYHHAKQLLELTEIQGVFLVGKPRHVEEYLLIGPHISFSHMPEWDIDLDISIKHDSYELLHVVGHTKEGKEGVKIFDLNQDVSHLSCLYPHLWQLEFKDGFHIEKFECHSQFDIGRLLQDLQYFRQTGLFCFSPQFIHRLSQFLPLEGCGLLAFCQFPDQSCTYELKGSVASSNDGKQHKGSLKGYKQDKKWVIDSLEWDDWIVYAELEPREEYWKIPFLGLNAGKSLLLGLEGDLNLSEGLLKGQLKFCETRLEQLGNYNQLRQLCSRWSPEGILKMTGDFEWACFSSDGWKGIKGCLLVDVQQLTIRDYPLQVLNPFHVKFENETFYLHDLQAELFPQKSQAQVHLHQLEYEPLQDSLSFLQLGFQIPAEQLEMVAQKLEHHFSEIFHPSFKNLLISSKQHGELKGTCTIGRTDLGKHFLNLTLEDGLYTFKKREYDVKHLELKIVDHQLQFSAFSQLERFPFQMKIQTQWPACQFGYCSLISKGVSQPLAIQWENHPKQGAIIHSLQGEFGGCYFNLKNGSQNDEKTILEGQIAIDFNRLSPLLTAPTAEMIQELKLGSLYSLSGRFWMNPDLGETLLETVFFQGLLKSQEAVIKGYQVKNFEADLQYIPGRLDVKNLLIQDPAGSVKAANFVAVLNQDHWDLFIPRLTVKNLRLSLLKDTELPMAQTNPKFRSLLIKRIDFQDFYGKLDELQTWQAKGSLHFLNPSRKNFFHPLFAIPAEIILRLGLDPQVLNPVTGTIYFNLEEERFYLTRFKDIYSEGRGSKFYLAQSPYPSWMDFNGNLFVQVRMKQYNLIFKIAELFTVSIQGNIKKPRYTLHKQSKALHKRHGLSLAGRDC